MCLKSTVGTCVHHTKQKGLQPPTRTTTPNTCINLRRSFALVTSDSSGAETTGTPLRIIQLFNFCDFTDSSIRRKYYLCNAITFVDMETFVHGAIFNLIKITPTSPRYDGSIVPGEFSTVMPCFNARPLRGRICPSTPAAAQRPAPS
jgi:hypothetical protein